MRKHTWASMIAAVVSLAAAGCADVEGSPQGGDRGKAEIGRTACGGEQAVKYITSRQFMFWSANGQHRQAPLDRFNALQQQETPYPQPASYGFCAAADAPMPEGVAVEGALVPAGWQLTASNWDMPNRRYVGESKHGAFHSVVRNGEMVLSRLYRLTDPEALSPGSVLRLSARMRFDRDTDDEGWFAIGLRPLEHASPRAPVRIDHPDIHWIQIKPNNLEEGHANFLHSQHIWGTGASKLFGGDIEQAKDLCEAAAGPATYNATNDRCEDDRGNDGQWRVAYAPHDAGDRYFRIDLGGWFAPLVQHRNVAVYIKWGVDTNKDPGLGIEISDIDLAVVEAENATIAQRPADTPLRHGDVIYGALALDGRGSNNTHQIDPAAIYGKTVCVELYADPTVGPLRLYNGTQSASPIEADGSVQMLCDTCSGDGCTFEVRVEDASPVPREDGAQSYVLRVVEPLG